MGRAPPARHACANAQISLEALLLFALFLSMLAMVLASSAQIRDMAQGRTGKAISQQAFNDFSSKAARACALGDGNVRVFSVINGEATITRTGSNSIDFTMFNLSNSLELPCNFGSIPPLPSNSFTIENSGGAIDIF